MEQLVSGNVEEGRAASQLSSLLVGWLFPSETPFKVVRNVAPTLGLSAYHMLQSLGICLNSDRSQANLSWDVSNTYPGVKTADLQLRPPEGLSQFSFIIGRRGSGLC